MTGIGAEGVDGTDADEDLYANTSSNLASTAHASTHPVTHLPNGK